MKLLSRRTIGLHKSRENLVVDHKFLSVVPDPLGRELKSFVKVKRLV